MTAWTTISNALVAVGAKPFATTIQALRDNVLAAFEGVLGAPRLQLPALERLLPGTSIRLRADSTVSVGTTYTPVPGFTVAVMQAGTVRIAWEHRQVGGGTSEVRLRRVRAGSLAIGTAQTNATGSFVAQTEDVTVQPGDVITVEHHNTSGIAASEIKNVRLQVDAANYLWPCGTMFGQIEGNPTITSP